MTRIYPRDAQRGCCRANADLRNESCMEPDAQPPRHQAAHGWTGELRFAPKAAYSCAREFWEIGSAAVGPGTDQTETHHHSTLADHLLTQPLGQGLNGHFLSRGDPTLHNEGKQPLH